ncbi:MAG: PAS domain S-box protein [Sulfurimonas sp.]|nr:PAS domain S-box protein [Sulfurimonas sp.]
MTKNKIDEAAELLFITLNNIPFAVITTTIDGTITSFNKEAEKMLGYAASELVGLHTPEILHDLFEVTQQAEKLSEELGIDIKPGFETFIIKTKYDLANEFEATYIAKDGQRIAVLLSVSALRDRHGTLIGYVGVAKDISKEKETHRQLLHSQQLLNEAQQIAKIGSWNLDLVKNHLQWSDEIFRIFEIDPNKFEASYEGFLNTIHPDDVKAVQNAFLKSLEEKTPYSITHRLIMSDGRVKYVEENGKTKYDKNDAPLFSQGTVQDVTESVRIDKKLKDYVALIDESVVTSSTDLEGNFTSVSEAFCRISKYSESELLGINHRTIRHPDMPKELYSQLWASLIRNKSWEGEIKNMAKDGSTFWVYVVISPIWNDMGEKIGYTAVHHDITDKKHAEFLSITDPLTGLSNRLKLDDVFLYELAQIKRYPAPLSILLLDVDDFKKVNDTYGHQIGDQVLQDIANILRSIGRTSDTIGRWGGEEFLIILPKTDLDGAKILAEKIRFAIESHSFAIAGSQTSSFGVAKLGTAENQDSLIERADSALYRAKSEGKNRVIG